jgi:hypothetical protein
MILVLTTPFRLIHEAIPGTAIFQPAVLREWIRSLGLPSKKAH